MIRVLQENLQDGLNIVKSGILERSRTLPILNHVKFEVDEGMVTLTTNDLETVTQCRIGCKVETPVSFTVPCKFLSDMVNIFHNDIIDISQGKDKNGSNIAIFKCNNQTVNLYTMDSADYPPLPVTEGQEFEIYDLSDAIKKVKDLIETEKYGTSQTDGLLFDMGLCQVVATDRKRMKVAHINATPIEGLKFRISEKAATILLKCKDTVKVTYQPGNGKYNSRIKFISGKMTIITQNLEGNSKYPEYMAIVNDETVRDRVEVF